MRINGLAQRVWLEDELAIEVGKPNSLLGGATVRAIVCTIEDETMHLMLQPVEGEPQQVEGEPQQVTYVHYHAYVEWVDRANLQSGTEWAMWTAEAVGRLKDLTPRDLEPQFLRFVPDAEPRERSGMNRTVQDLVGTEFQFADQFADTGELSPPRFVRMKSPFYDGERWAVRWNGRCLTKTAGWEYEPMPLSRDDAFYARCRFDTLEHAVDTWNRAEVKPREAGPKLEVVRPSQAAPASTLRRVVDAQAGGPEGFDPDGPIEAGKRVEVEIRGIEDRAGENVFVAATDQDFDPQQLQGKTVRYGEGQYVVKSAELGEQDDQEVVYLRVDELRE